MLKVVAFVYGQILVFFLSEVLDSVAVSIVGFPEISTG